MAKNLSNATSAPGSDAPTIFTPSVTSEGTTVEPERNTSAIPWPGSTYIIRNVSTGKVVTFRRGKIIMGPIVGHNAFRWECVEKNGWFGFREPASYRFLGYDLYGEIICAAEKHLTWENFMIRQRPDGKHMMLMWDDGQTYRSGWKGFRPVGFKIEKQSEKLTILEDWKSTTIAWEFIKVESCEL